MPTLIVEDGTGLAGANSYCGVVEADDYHDTRLHSQLWLEADEYKKQQALIWATRLLDEHCWWRGTRTSTTQMLEWPQTGVATTAGNGFIDPTAMPAWLKNATAELARLLLEKDRPGDAELARTVSSSSGGRSRSLGLPDGNYKAVLPPSVMSMVSPYTIRGVSKLVRAA